jgi:hypothetical protein
MSANIENRDSNSNSNSNNRRFNVLRLIKTTDSSKTIIKQQKVAGLIGNNKKRSKQCGERLNTWNRVEEEKLIDRLQARFRRLN